MKMFTRLLWMNLRAFQARRREFKVQVSAVQRTTSSESVSNRERRRGGLFLVFQS